MAGQNMEKSKALFLALFALLLGITGGILIGYFITVDDGSKSQQAAKYNEMFKTLNRDEWKDEPNIKSKIISQIEPDRIRENLREFSKEPHIAGTPRDEELAKVIRDRWLKNGFDSAELVPYKVLLSHPNPKKPNKINIMGYTNEVDIEIVPIESPLRDEDKTDHMNQAFHAYSPSGIAEGEIVYANEGLSFDFELLEKLNVDVKGKIVLVLESGMNAAIRNAHKHGAVGVLTFPDPMHYARVGVTKADVYPNSTLLPGSAIISTPVQYHHKIGDMLTPGYPATEHVYRTPLKNGTFSSIPSQPIGYSDAMKLLSLLDGPIMPEEWSLNPDLKYFRIGPTFLDDNHRSAQLIVNNRMELTTIYNVIGIIKGNVEPDRYVIYGNHRDAWSFGAVDPASGTAVMLELSRVFGNLLREGWKPRRTIVFASWSGEEYGIIGSTEWVEEKLPKLHHRAVLYINTDICAIGKNFFPTASKVISSAIFEVAKLVPDPEGKLSNVYETMFNQSLFENVSTPEHAMFYESFIMSDHVPFGLFGAIPYIDVNWRREFNIMTSEPLYPPYHTGYDTFYYMDKFVDPDYKFHCGCAQLSGLLMHYMTDSLLLPLNLTSYTETFDRLAERLKSLNHIGISMDPLLEAKSAFQNSTEDWYRRLETTDMTNPLVVRMLNDQLMQLERSSIFLKSPRINRETDLEDRNSLVRSMFSIFDSVRKIALMIEETERNETATQIEIENIRGCISDLSIGINQAAQTLLPFHEI